VTLFITPLNKQLCERIVGRRKLLGEDLVFDLQGLLVERFGVNLRNRMAHALMGDEFASPNVLYLWWRVLRICMIYVLVNRNPKREETR
jgi:hypothetical protein